jgi:hypothetical protein
MQSQQGSSGLVTPFLTTGSALKAYSANAVVPAWVDFIEATGGVGGIMLTLTPGAIPTGDPTNPRVLYQIYQAAKEDAAAGIITFVDPNGALFNGQSSYVLNNQYQWAIFQWNGVGWRVIGN